MPVQAIDVMTRRLIASGQRPVTVGLFFSLGHSTYVRSAKQERFNPGLADFGNRIVVITSIVVAATAAAVSTKFDRFSKVGGIIGTSISAGFLILLALLNLYVLYKLVQRLRSILAVAPGTEEKHLKIQGGGILFSIFRKLFKLIDRLISEEVLS